MIVLKHIERLLDELCLINSSFEEDKKMKEVIFFGLARAIERKTYSLKIYLFVLNKYPIAMEMISDFTVFDVVLSMISSPADLTSDSTADALENLQKLRKVLKRIGRPIDTVSKWVNIFRLMASDPLQDLLYMNCGVVEEIFERFQANESVSDLFLSQREIFEDQDYWNTVVSLLVAIDGDYEISLSAEDQVKLPEVSMNPSKLELTEVENIDEEGWNEEESDLDLPSDKDDIIAESQEIIADNESNYNLSAEKVQSAGKSVDRAVNTEEEVDENSESRNISAECQLAGTETVLSVKNDEDDEVGWNDGEESNLDLPDDDDDKFDVKEQNASSDKIQNDENSELIETPASNEEETIVKETLDEEVDENAEHQNISTECEPSKTTSENNDNDEEDGWNEGEESDIDLPDEGEDLSTSEMNISEENSKNNEDECSEVDNILENIKSNDEETNEEDDKSASTSQTGWDNEESDIDIPSEAENEHQIDMSSEKTGWDNEESDLELPSDSGDDSEATIPEKSSRDEKADSSTQPIETRLEGSTDAVALSETEEYAPDAAIKVDEKSNDPVPASGSVSPVEPVLSDKSSNHGWDQDESDIELPSDDNQDAQELETDIITGVRKIQKDERDEEVSGWNNEDETALDLASDVSEIVPGKTASERTENDAPAEENDGWQNDDESDLDLPSDLEDEKTGDVRSPTPEGWEGDESDLDLVSEVPSSPAPVDSSDVQSPEPEGWNQESDIDLDSDEQSDNGGWEDDDLDLVDDDDSPLEALLNRYHAALRNPESEDDLKGLISGTVL